MAASTISLKRTGEGSHTFESFKRGYTLDYTPDPKVRGAFGYTLFTDAGKMVSKFATLNEARRWITEVGFNTLDTIAEGTEDESAE
jgi:hypothetical protein